MSEAATRERGMGERGLDARSGSAGTGGAGEALLDIRDLTIALPAGADRRFAARWCAWSASPARASR
jgi:hypothetical protein